MGELSTEPVLVAHHAALMRRILRVNLEVEHITAVEAGTVAECLDWLRERRAGAVVLDAGMITNPHDEAAICAMLRSLGVPVLVIADGPERRGLARALGGAPYCHRPDRVDRITLAVRKLLAGAPVPAMV
ncbi:MAG: hypothetical protein HYX51_03585 [Chloroflexi bacterium]|nr:hypothetical protein [Chloroflexota bacterium]